MQVNSIESSPNIKSASSINLEPKMPIAQLQNDSRSITGVFSDYKKFIFNKAKKVTIKDEFGIERQAFLISTNSGLKYIEYQGEVLGCMNFSFSKAPIRGDNYPEEYKNKKYLFINSIYSNKKYKNVGTQLIKSAIKESQKRGCEGRVCLNTSTTRPKIGSPVPFYYKLGFEASSKETQYKIKKAMDLQTKLPEECEAITMFLPMEVVNKIL